MEKIAGRIVKEEEASMFSEKPVPWRNPTPSDSTETEERVGVAKGIEVLLGNYATRVKGRGSRCGWRSLFLPRLNKRSLYVYGSEVGVERECARQEETGAWVIHPFSQIRDYYVMFMVTVTILNLIGIPMEIAFLDGSSGRGWVGFNVFSDTLFLCDVALNFRMGILSDDSEVVILDLRMVRHKYLRSWFVPDVVASFPVGYLLLIADLQYQGDTTSLTANKMMRILMFGRILSLVRLLRVSRLVRFFNEASIANLETLRLVLRVIGLFMMMFLLCHWNGCIQYFVPLLDGFPAECWVRKEHLMNATLGEKYSFGVFRALSHMIGISYGSSDTPTDEVELWVVMTSMVSGALMYTMMVANAAAMMTNVDASLKAYKSKVKRLEDYMANLKLPKELRSRVISYYQARYGGKWFDEKEVLTLVSHTLKEEVLTAMCASLLKNAPIFQNRDVNFISAILHKLQYEVFQEGDIIIRKNAGGDRMFFIEHGHVLVETAAFQKELSDGKYFGEMCLLGRPKGVATVRALTLCQLFSLSRESFHQVLQEFPEIRLDMERTAQWKTDDLSEPVSTEGGRTNGRTST